MRWNGCPPSSRMGPHHEEHHHHDSTEKPRGTTASAAGCHGCDPGYQDTTPVAFDTGLTLLAFRRQLSTEPRSKAAFLLVGVGHPSSCGTADDMHVEQGGKDADPDCRLAHVAVVGDSCDLGRQWERGGCFRSSGDTGEERQEA